MNHEMARRAGERIGKTMRSIALSYEEQFRLLPQDAIMQAEYKHCATFARAFIKALHDLDHQSVLTPEAVGYKRSIPGIWFLRVGELLMKDHEAGAPPPSPIGAKH